ncbi:type II toxin-antitoxin system Phd/YefM family antitoxin [Synechocystis sp. FACHB-383]|uniref:type II toxin-antitoxin system Phd/YefM family antitoxin n=1 Tax=Synechocystis sp. FACHB-383 TaxID=2692864 RepID=UPI001F54D1FD|nr:type II toxin-antitoxin system Phd/YefM family antitoxin [Synechocystis sp. FACHB-383]
MASFTAPSDNSASQGLDTLQTWKLEDAKARFSELVRLAQAENPQLVTVRGKDAAVVLAADQFAKLLPLMTQPNIHEFLSQSPLNRLDFDQSSVQSPVSYEGLAIRYQRNFRTSQGELSSSSESLGRSPISHLFLSQYHYDGGNSFWHSKD